MLVEPPRPRAGQAPRRRSRGGRAAVVRRSIRWRAVARILIVAGGCRGRSLASAMVGEGHTVRITTRSEHARAAIEATGAECWIGTPDRLATLRGALENVTVLCWLLASASGTPEELGALHGSRLEYFMTQAIDTTVRGVVYEARGAGASAGAGADGEADAEMLAGGEAIVRALAERNAIPAAFLTAHPHERDAWLADARAAVASLL
jgi:hypothetical protein